MFVALVLLLCVFLASLIIFPVVGKTSARRNVTRSFALMFVASQRANMTIGEFFERVAYSLNLDPRRVLSVQKGTRMEDATQEQLGTLVLLLMEFWFLQKVIKRPDENSLLQGTRDTKQLAALAARELQTEILWAEKNFQFVADQRNTCRPKFRTITEAAE
jgi:hypothetical protein